MKSVQTPPLRPPLPLATHTPGKSKHLREKKVAQRKRTRDLYYALDPLVPVCTRPPLAEKGCLPSKRTFLQLQDDTVDHLRVLKAERDGAGPAKRRDVKKGQSSSSIDNHTMGSGALAWAMLASPNLVLIEVDLHNWTVVRISEGCGALFQKLPLDHSIIGECLLHYCDLESAKVLRIAGSQRCSDASESDSANSNQFNIHLRTWEHFTINIRGFRVERFGCKAPDRELFMLSPLDPIPASLTPAFGWTIEKMRDLCGVYQFDTGNTTHPPWNIEEMVDQLERADSHVGWHSIALSSLLSTDIAKLAVEGMAVPHGFTPSLFNTWSHRFKGMMMNMLQMHLTFDMKSDGQRVPLLKLHVRLKLPNVTGALRTPWVPLASVQLNGTPVVALSTHSKQIKIFAKCSPEGELHMVTMYFRKTSTAAAAGRNPNGAHAHAHKTEDSTSLQCYHSRQWIVSSQGINISGEVFQETGACVYMYMYMCVQP
jgi:hypothetical protein